jgi:opacity protein-like surface antigen
VIYPGENPTNTSNNYQQYGAFLRTGIKFLRAFSPYQDNERSRHPLEGTYIKPEIVVGCFSETNPLNANRYRTSTIAGAIMVNFGKQYAFGDRLLVYYDMGVGYAFSNENMTRINNGERYRPYGLYYSHFGTPNARIPIAFSASFGIGYIFAK